MQRVDNWPLVLSHFIEARRSQPFEWGVNDCCLFASDWVRACTGIDPAEAIRGSYSSALSAARVISAHGGMIGIVQQLGEPLGMEPVHAWSAGRGDLVIQDNGKGASLGIVLGPCAAFVAADGLMFFPFSNSPCWKL